MTAFALHMGWRHVLFGNWPVDPAVVRPHLPDALALDTYDGHAWLSVVPFTNVDVRPPWAPGAVGFPLPELNLRTYVTPAAETGGGTAPSNERSGDHDAGVYFFSLDAQGVLGVLGARIAHFLPYYYARIDLTVDDDGTVSFDSRRCHPGGRPATFRGTYRPTGDRLSVAPDSLASFLTERYRYYTESPWGTLRYASIDHDPWPLYAAEVEIGTNTLFGANCFDEPPGEPVHYYSPGVDTIASRSRRA